MDMPLTLKVFSVSVCIFAGIPLIHAQTDFSGSWTFKIQESISGNLYSNGSPKSVLIEQDAKAISITKVTAGSDGDVTTTETVSFNGQPFATTTASKRKKAITGQWSTDKKSFTEIALVFDATDSTKLYFRTTDTWSFENGALMLDRKAENQSNGEIWESRAIYDKR
jgi:hypothetical protein